MARPKRSSTSIDTAQRRMAAMESIAKNLDLGNGFTMDRFSTAIQEAQNHLNDYNTQLSIADAAKSRLEDSEKALNALAKQMLQAVAVKFGEDSLEYEKAGGTRRSDRKRRTVRPKAEMTA